MQHLSPISLNCLPIRLSQLILIRSASSIKVSQPSVQGAAGLGGSLWSAVSSAAFGFVIVLCDNFGGCLGNSLCLTVSLFRCKGNFPLALNKTSLGKKESPLDSLDRDIKQTSTNANKHSSFQPSPGGISDWKGPIGTIYGFLISELTPPAVTNDTPPPPPPDRTRTSTPRHASISCANHRPLPVANFQHLICEHYQ
ncbi:uncharacterized protein [Nothobranchius furzeri]|uniref:uncharacterized protein isoform X2 n=1 Tax=Nothobranchius furzeri TaxID=105023 RepID=UPI0039047859